MRALQLNSDNDLVIESGRLVVIDGQDQIEQSIKTRLLTVRGDWIYDLNDGIPYLDRVLIKGPDLGLLRQLFSEAILETPGVASIVSLLLDVDNATRVLTLNASVQLETDPETVLETSVDISI